MFVRSHKNDWGIVNVKGPGSGSWYGWLEWEPLLSPGAEFWLFKMAWAGHFWPWVSQRNQPIYFGSSLNCGCALKWALMRFFRLVFVLSLDSVRAVEMSWRSGLFFIDKVPVYVLICPCSAHTLNLSCSFTNLHAAVSAFLDTFCLSSSLCQSQASKPSSKFRHSARTFSFFFFLFVSCVFIQCFKSQISLTARAQCASRNATQDERASFWAITLAMWACWSFLLPPEDTTITEAWAVAEAVQDEQHVVL